MNIHRTAASARLLLLAGGLALLAGCSGTLLPRPAAPPARHTLGEARPAPAPRAAEPGAPALTVDMPRAAPGYDGRHMLYMRQPQQLEQFAFHEWVAAPAEMLQGQLVRALQDTGAFRVVLGAPSAATSGWRLETELIHLHQDFGVQPSRLRLALRAVLLDTATRQVIAWRAFDVAVATAGDDPVAGVVAARTAARDVLGAMAAFCAEQVRPVVPPPR